MGKRRRVQYLGKVGGSLYVMALIDGDSRLLQSPHLSVAVGSRLSKHGMAGLNFNLADGPVGGCYALDNTTPSIRESWAARGDCTPGTSCGTHAHDPQKLAGKVTVEDDARVITSEGVRGERSTCQGTRTNGRRRADRH
jgi:hypothetical protein